jgi:hypothetical protein
MECKHQFSFSRYCGADVCHGCGLHAHINRKTGEIGQTLARCYCGWSASGGDGRQELRDFGETIEPDEY